VKTVVFDVEAGVADGTGSRNQVIRGDLLKGLFAVHESRKEQYLDIKVPDPLKSKFSSIKAQQ